MDKLAPDKEWSWLRRCVPQPVIVERTQSGVILLCGQPPSVVLRLNGAALRIGTFGAQKWRDVTALADTPIASLRWSSLPTDTTAREKVIAHLCAAASELHAARLRQQGTIAAAELTEED